MSLNHVWITRIRDVEREYLVMRLAADRLLTAASVDPTVLLDTLRPRELTVASTNLEGTYLIRLFAEFESGAREYWSTTRVTNPKTVDLLTGLAAQRQIPDMLRENVQSVRDYRNSWVHERAVVPQVIPIDIARSYLCRFFSFLPPQW